ncbi:hypothetical protein T439DRAFT_323957 [Meredithblackwellia eburnea MCA 4105]
MTVAVKFTLPLPIGSQQPSALETRKIHLQRPLATTSWHQLTTTVKQRFGLNRYQRLAFTSKDIDGDNITISTDDEIKDLFTSVDNDPSVSVIRLTITFQNSSILPTSLSDLSHPTSTTSPTDQPDPDEEERHVAQATVHSPLHSTTHTEEEDDEDDDFEILSDVSSTPGDEHEAQSEAGTDVPYIPNKGKERDFSHTDTHTDVDHDPWKDQSAFDPERATTPTPAQHSPLDHFGGATAPPTAEPDAQVPDFIHELEQEQVKGEEEQDPVEQPLPTTTEKEGQHNEDDDDDDPVDSPLPPSSSPASVTGAFPANLSSFLSSLPATFQTLLNTPGTPQERLNVLLARAHPSSNPPRPNAASSPAQHALDQLPDVALGFVAEVCDAVSELRESFRREADGIRREFEEFKKGVEGEAEKVRREFSSSSQVRNSNSTTQTETRAETPAPVETAPSHSQPPTTSSEDAEFEAATKASLEAYYAQKVKEEVAKALREAKEHRRKKRALRKAAKEQRKQDRAAAAAGADAKGTTNPFDDSNVPPVDSSDDEEDEVTVTTPVVDVPLAPPAATTPSTIEPSRDDRDDFFKRKVDGPRRSMPGEFAGPTAGATLIDLATTPSSSSSSLNVGVERAAEEKMKTTTCPPLSTSSIAPYPTLTRSSTLPPPPSSSNPFRGPNNSSSFANVTGTGLPRSYSPPSSSSSPQAPVPTPHPQKRYSMPGTFDPLTTPHPLPLASTSRRRLTQEGEDHLIVTGTVPAASEGGNEEEVLPSELKEAVRKLGFDVAGDLGTRIACERVWEEKRGQKLEVMVEGVLQKLL